METVVLGRTGLTVSVAGLGCGGPSRLGCSQGRSPDQAKAVVEAAMNQGVTYIDLAVAYGTEALVGEAIAGRRDGLVLCTKVPPMTRGRFTPWHRPPPAKEFRRTLEESLRRLKTDRLDIVMLHSLAAKDYRRCRDALVPLLQDLQREGKLRFIGVSESVDRDPEHAMLRLAADDDCWDVAMIAHNPYNAAAGRPLLARLRETNVGVVAMVPSRWLARYAAEEAEDLLRRAALDDSNEAQPATESEAAPPASPSERRRLIDAAYRFCRHSPGVDLVLTGTGNLAHLQDNLRSLMAGPL